MGLQEEKERIIQVQERRASAAEESVGWAKERLGAANRKNEELEARIATIQHDASLTQKAAEQALSSTKNESHAQLTILQKQISQLENVNAEANVRAEKLIELYRTGKLVRLSKIFDYEIGPTCYFRLTSRNHSCLTSSARRKRFRKNES